MKEQLHQPVLAREVLRVLQPQPGESYLDLTAGYAGHASQVLALTQQYETSVLCDRDEFAIQYLQQKFASMPIRIINCDFYTAAQQLTQEGAAFNLILADLGVSSPQLDNPERGFSFMHDGPLDMRMDRTQTLSADIILNQWSVERLAKVLQQYGELSPGLSQKYARNIVYGRPWHSTLELANAKFWGRRGRIHPATKVFQAVRIAVNDELGLLERTLPLLPELLAPGGRVAIISFHSLEDRIVKQFFKAASSLGEESALEILTKKPLVAESMELGINPRARSAKLRAARRR